MKQNLLSFVAIVLLVSTCSLFAGWQFTHSDQAPILDGLLTEDVWQAVPWQTDFTMMAENTAKPSEETRCKLIVTSQGLWIGVECQDAFIQSIERNKDEATWLDDCVEVFISPHALINPDPNLQDYYQFILTPSSSVFDGHSIGGVLNDRWDCHFQFKAAKISTGWSMEFFLPFSALMPCDFDTWHLMIARENVMSGNNVREIVCLPHVSLLGNPPQYAPIAGLNIDSKRFGCSLEKLDLDTEINAEGTKCFLVGELQAPFSEEAELKCRILDSGKQQAAFVSQRVNFSQGKADFRIPVSLEQNGDYTVRMYLLDQQGLVFQDSKNVHLEISPLTIKTVWPVLHDVILSSMPDKTARLLVSCNLSSELLNDCTLLVKATHQKTGMVLREDILSLASGKAEVSVPLETVEPGKVAITLNLQQADKIIFSCGKEISILPASQGNEVWVDSQRRVVVNGVPVFLRGFYGVYQQNFEDLKACGCNLVQSYGLNSFSKEELLEYFDNLHSHGMKAIMYPYIHMGVSPKGLTMGGQLNVALSQEHKQKIIDFVNSIKDHPALLGWYLFDEPRDDKFLNTLHEINLLIHDVDPYHITLGCNDSGSGCLDVQECVDVLIPDIYPAPHRGTEVLGRPIASIFNQVRSIAQKTEANGILYAPQAFDWDCYTERPNNHRSLNFKEIRISVFGNIIAGSCSGIIPYTIGNPDIKYGEHNSNSGIYCWPDMKIGYLQGIFPDLCALEKVLLSSDAESDIKCDNGDVKHLTKLTTGSDGKSHTYVFACNVLPKDIGEATILWPCDAVVRLLGEEMPIKQDGRKIVLPFDKYAVHILTDDPDFQLPTTVEAIQRKIDEDMAQIPQ